MEKTGFNLFRGFQECDRWTLLTKNNFEHSALTVNNEMFINNATAELVDFKDGKTPEATFDMTPIYGEIVKNAKRRFVKDSPTSIVIEDQLETSKKQT